MYTRYNSTFVEQYRNTLCGGKLIWSIPVSMHIHDWLEQRKSGIAFTVRANLQNVGSYRACVYVSMWNGMSNGKIEKYSLTFHRNVDCEMRSLYIYTEWDIIFHLTCDSLFQKILFSLIFFLYSCVSPY